MKTLTLGFFNNVLTKEEGEVAFQILCDYVDPDGVIYINHLYRDFVETKYFVKMLKDADVINDYGKDILDSIDKKLKDNMCDYYSAFEKGNPTDYLESGEYDIDVDEFVEKNTITKKSLKFVVLESVLEITDYLKLKQILKDHFGEDYLEDETAAWGFDEDDDRFVFSQKEIIDVLKEHEDEDTERISQEVEDLICDYVLV